MLKNFLIIAYRRIKREKSFSFINILGFSIGIACSLLVILWVQDELSFDKSHQKKDRIYRICSKILDSQGETNTSITPGALAPLLEKQFPGIEKATRFRSLSHFTFIIGDKSFSEPHSALAESSLFSIFSFPFIEGNPTNCLNEPNSIVLTNKLAQKYFGEKTALNKEIEIPDLGNFRVTGVIEDVDHCHFHFNYLIPFLWSKTIFSDDIVGLGSFNYTTYILARKGIDYENLENKIKGFYNTYSNADYKDNEINATLSLQKLEDIYLKSDYAYDFIDKGNIDNVYLFSAIAFIVLLIASINFMNLTTARSAKRTKEIAVRKAFGSQRKHLIFQFYIETVFVTLLSFVLALLFVETALPVFNYLSGKELGFGAILSTDIVIIYLILALVTSIFAGSYPALYLSSFRPINILRGQKLFSPGHATPRRALVVVQFSIAIVLIISTLVINRQLNFIKNKELGYDPGNLYIIQLRDDIRDNYDDLVNRLLSSSSITHVSAISSPLTYAGPSLNVDTWSGKKGIGKIRMHYYSVYYDFLKTLGIELLNGKPFTPLQRLDTSYTFLINEAAAKRMQLENPIGKKIKLGDKKGKIQGVFEDFHYNSLHYKVEPLVLSLNRRGPGGLIIRAKDGNMAESLHHAEKIWNTLDHKHPFTYVFLEEEIAHLYQQEERTGILFQYFAIFAILISCLGLFGLASYMTQQRRKEIGIRKVLGAGTNQLTLLLTKDFVKWVIISAIIGLPIGFYAMKQWLQEFYYKIDISPFLFIYTLAIAIGIAMITVGIQTYKAAIQNPVDNLVGE